MHSAPQQEDVPHDLGLLLDTVSIQGPAWAQRIVVTTKRVPHQRQVPSPAPLGLPDVGHFMQEQRLQLRPLHAEVVTVEG